MQCKASFFNGVNSKKSIYTLEIYSDHIFVQEKNITIDFDDVKISKKLKGVPQTITLKDGSFFTLERHCTVQTGFITKLESRYLYSILALFVLIGFITFSLTIGSNSTTKLIANMLPKHTLDRISEKTIEQLKQEGYIKKSHLPLKTKEYIKEHLKIITPKNVHIKLHFVTSNLFKANAFALPSGDIFITDSLISLEKDKKYRGILGILAHEVGHVKQKHALRNIVKTSISAVVIGYFVGDFSHIVTITATGLMNLSYSREFEMEADNEAIDMLRKNYISIKPLIDIFQALQKRSPKTNPFISTHPMFKQRITNFTTSMK